MPIFDEEGDTGSTVLVSLYVFPGSLKHFCRYIHCAIIQRELLEIPK